MVQPIDPITGLQIGNIYLLHEIYKHKFGRLMDMKDFTELVKCFYEPLFNELDNGRTNDFIKQAKESAYTAVPINEPLIDSVVF